MAEFFSLLFDWRELAGYGADVAMYGALALVATVLFLLRLALTLFLGMDSDFDLDIDASGTDAAFGFFSVLSILAFFMGTGWMGLTARLTWELGPMPAALAAMGFGLGMMLLASGLMYGVRRMSREARYDVETAVGKTARVYLTIPPKDKGRGQVEVNVSNRRKVMYARQEGNEPIAPFTTIRIVSADDDETFVVEPL